MSKQAEQLGEMGFAPESVEAALAAANDNFEAALELLMSNALDGGAGANEGGGTSAATFDFDATRVIRLESSQYSFDCGRSACTTIACEAATRLLECESLDSMNEEILSDVLMAGVESYQSGGQVEHQACDEVLRRVPKYRRSLEVLSEEQGLTTTRHAFREVIRSAVDHATSRSAPIAIIITKPPETVLVLVFPSSGGDDDDEGDREGRVFHLFDSHPRPELGLEGAYLATFGSRGGLCGALRSLFPGVQLDDEGGMDAGLAASMYNTYEATCVARPTAVSYDDVGISLDLE